MSDSALREHSITLGSGLRVTAVHLPHVHRIVINAHLRSGPAFEERQHNGICHFLEHMLYRGTPTLPTAHAQSEAFESLGGNLSATTYVDHGSVTVGIPVESFDAVLELFADVYRHPTFSGIDIEKGIVLEEILEGLDDDDQRIDADEIVRELCFRDHPLGQPIVGSPATLERFDRSLLASTHASLYVGANTRLVIAGPIDTEQALAAAQRRFDGLAAGQRPECDALEPQLERRFRYVKHAASQTELRVAFRAPGDADPLEPAADILLRVIDDGMSTRLYHRLCDELGLCYEVSAGYESYEIGGIFDLSAQTANERSPQVLDELFALVRALRDEGPTDAEISKIKARLRWTFEEMPDDPGAVAQVIGARQLSSAARTIEERREALLAVTREQVRAAAHRIFVPQGLSVVAVGSLDKRRRSRLERTVDAF